MRRRSEEHSRDWSELRNRIIGLGEQSSHKNYYSELKARLRELEESRRSLAAANASLQAVMDAATEVAIIATSQDGTITIFNQGAENLLGYRAEELIGTATVLLFHLPLEVEQRGAELSAQYSHTVTGFQTFIESTEHGHAEKREWTYICKDGRYLQVELVVTAIRGENGVINGYLGVAQDITERKQAEASLRRMNLDLEEARQATEKLNRLLEQRISEALVDIRHKDRLLIQQGRQAAMGEMISNIAHQWRQPLNNIALLIQNLQLLCNSGELSPQQCDQDVAKALEIIQFMSGTINNFRNIFRQDATPQRFSVNQAVAKIVDFLAAGMTGQGITVSCVEKEEVSITGYPGEYHQALINILNNAREALLFRAVPKALIRITIFKEQGQGVVTVWDNGGGIDAAILPKIFDPYFTTKFKSQGTGLGLFMAKAIIENSMQGRLTARNINGGAELRIEVSSPETVSGRPVSA